MSLEDVFPHPREERSLRIERELSLLKHLLEIMDREAIEK